ncbi:Sec-independent protein translocase protein TatB [Salinisphaera sp. T31B1]|uniref:Sec-independent protein translocase protein TatB n=1 Tax=Salinisphaera sp. T31B1 TaxID=727963 RepID=UPI0033426F9D
MFDVGFWELALMAVIGLIVLGPERLPVVARTLGTWIGRAKGYVRGLTSELEREVNVDDLRSQVRRAREQIEADTRETASQVKTSVDPDAPRSRAEATARMSERGEPTQARTASPDDSQSSPGEQDTTNPVADAARHDDRHS